MKKLLTVAVLAFSLTGFAQKVYIPNAFSPDGDSRNDVWKPIFNDTLSISNYLLEVYTRNGQLVFETRDSNGFWDGEYYLSEIESETTFVYRLVARIDNDDVREEGFIQIVR
jgi:gliding motility-associated-like protein